MSDQYTFPCGCSWGILGQSENGPLLDFSIDKLPDCPAVWDFFATGKTVGIFQLEKALGRRWTKRLRPTSLEHLFALTALLRPGCLLSQDAEGVSMTERYCRRKNEEEEVRPFHPAVDKLLESTYQIVVYQEQSMSIAGAICKFTPKEVNRLRKCVCGDTMFVSKQRGWVSIKTLMETGYENDDFLIMDETGKQQWKKIEKIWHTGKKSVATVKSSTGFSIRATHNHQFLTTTGWKARQRLQNDDYLIAAREVNWEGCDTISSDMAIIIAGLITEGHIIDGPRVASFTTFDQMMMTTFLNAFESVFNEKLRLGNEGRVAYLRAKHKLELSKHMTFGLSATKRLPQSMMGMTKETTRRFLSFMLAAEGGICVNSGTFDFSSKSLTLIKQVKLLLLRFGVRSYYLQKEIPEYGTHWRLYINDQFDQKKLLTELTLMWPSCKKESLATVLSKKKHANYTTDVFPQHIIKRLLDQYPSVGNYEGGSIYKSPISRTRFRRLANATKDNCWINLCDGFQQYDTIADMNFKQSLVDVYDFTVAGGDTPYIIANGLVIHNSIGKKIASEISAVGKLFKEKGKAAGIVPEATVNELWGILEASGRYQFNRAHSASYGLRAYQQAYQKVHFPLAFFTGKLRCAHGKADAAEKRRWFVSDAKTFDVEVLGPDLRYPEHYCFTDGKSVRFGLADIRDVGEGEVNKLKILVKDKPLNNWMGVLFGVLVHSNARAVKPLILSGALDFLQVPRQRMLSEYERLKDVSKGVSSWAYENSSKYNSLSELLRAASRPRKEGGAASKPEQTQVLGDVADILESPSSALVDTPADNARLERTLLGINLSCSKVDGCDLSAVNSNCKELLQGRVGSVTIGVEVSAVIPTVTKKGKNPGQAMARLTLADSTGEIEAVCFPDAWAVFASLLVPDNTVIIKGKQQKEGGLIIEQVWQTSVIQPVFDVDVELEF